LSPLVTFIRGARRRRRHAGAIVLERGFLRRGRLLRGCRDLCCQRYN